MNLVQLHLAVQIWQYLYIIIIIIKRYLNSTSMNTVLISSNIYTPCRDVIYNPQIPQPNNMLISIRFTLSMHILIQPRKRIHVMVTRSSNATLYLSQWPGHTTSSRIIQYTNHPLSICCEYSKEPSRWDCSLEHPKHTPMSMSNQTANPKITIILLFSKSMVLSSIT